jgi:hypothetical protein
VDGVVGLAEAVGDGRGRRGVALILLPRGLRANSIGQSGLRLLEQRDSTTRRTNQHEAYCRRSKLPRLKFLVGIDFECDSATKLYSQFSRATDRDSNYRGVEKG